MAAFVYARYVVAHNRRRAPGAPPPGAAAGGGPAARRLRAGRPGARPSRRGRDCRGCGSAAASRAGRGPRCRHRPGTPTWKPPVSALALEAPPASRSWVREVAIADRTARPMAPPNCCEVLISPLARPCSRGRHAGDRRDRRGHEAESEADGRQQRGPEDVVHEAAADRDPAEPQQTPPPPRAIPIARIGLKPKRVTSWPPRPAETMIAADSGRYERPAWIGPVAEHLLHVEGHEEEHREQRGPEQQPDHVGAEDGAGCGRSGTGPAAPSSAARSPRRPPSSTADATTGRRSWSSPSRRCSRRAARRPAATGRP